MEDATLARLNPAQLAEVALPHWAQLSAVLAALPEEQVAVLLAWELSHRKNAAIVRRLHQRLSALRTTRERAALLQALEKGQFKELRDWREAKQKLRTAGIIQ